MTKSDKSDWDVSDRDRGKEGGDCVKLDAKIGQSHLQYNKMVRKTGKLAIGNDNEVESMKKLKEK